MNVREHLARLEERLDNLLAGQKGIQELLEERRKVWDTASVKVNVLITILTSGAVLGILVALTREILK